MPARPSLGVALASIVLVLGCTIDVPLPGAGPLDDLSGFFANVQRDLENAIEDPFDADPFPIVIGGDSERVFYATNLTDIRLNFPGPNDVVLPGIIGPSNVYKLQDRQRELIRPLALTNAVAGMATDGRFVAYMTIADLDATPRVGVAVSDLQRIEERLIYLPEDAEETAVTDLALDNGRLAFVIQNFVDGGFVLRVEDLSEIEPAVEIQADWIADMQLRGDRLGYLETAPGDVSRIVLRDLATGDATIVASLSPGQWSARLFLANNTLVWSEPNPADVARVTAYDIPTGRTRVWADAVPGELAGASDVFFVTETYISDLKGDKPERIAVTRYDIDGGSKELARFNAGGFAGQTQVLGNRAIWVNPDRKIVIQPLAGGERDIFRPF
jgi:hypothetical protein